MSVYDDIYRDVNSRQDQARAEARQWANIRAQSIRSGDRSMADDALAHIGGIKGADAEFWTGIRDTAIRNGDRGLAETARNKANEAGPGGFGGRGPY